MHLPPMALLLGLSLFSGLLSFPTATQAEVLLLSSATPETTQPGLYQHPLFPSLVFINPQTRGQAILPPAPVFVAPPPLLWRAPRTADSAAMAIPYPPTASPGFNRSGSPSNRDLASYNLARAHAMSQRLYRRDTALNLHYGTASRPSPMIWYGADTWGWNAPYYLHYPPAAPGQTHPSNRDNASYLIDRAHRYSQDAYRKP